MIFIVGFLLGFRCSVSEGTPMEHIYVLFEMLRVPCVFVVRGDELRGIITKRNLLRRLQTSRESRLRDSTEQASSQ